MNNFKQPGKSVEYVNAGSAIASGAVVPLVDSVGIALTDIAATTGKGTVQLEGVFECAKDADEAFAIGDSLYYDSSDATMTKTAAGNIPAGKAHAAALEAATTCLVRIGDHSQRAANVAALAQDISASPTEAEVQAISTKVDAILTALKNAGLMKNA